MRATHRAVSAAVPALLVLAWAAFAPVSPLFAQTLAAGVDHTCTVTAAGGTVCWGSNQYGQIGDGTTILRTTPTNVNVPFGVTALTGNWGHTCAVTPSGGVKCWGWNDYGQLGDGTKTQRLTPTDVSGLSSGVSRIAAGYGHTCAIVTGGMVKCWGADYSSASNQGQLGNGTTSGSLAAVDVSGLGTGVQDIAVGKNHACAVTAGGGVKCWGANNWDQLGDPSDFNDKSIPGDVSTLSSGAVKVSAGESHSCALTMDGGVKCWGLRLDGALGDGMMSPTTSAAPVTPTGLSAGVGAISAGKTHTCALLTNGDVYCWGANTQGQLGDGSNTQRNSPIFVLAGAIAISAGAFHTCALISPGNIRCWGNNAQGNLGIGSVGSPSYAPTTPVFPSPTSTALVSGTNTSVYGDNVIFSATVTDGMNGTGVRFESDGVPIPGCTSVSLSAGSANCTTTSLQSGIRSIRAIYLGNASTLASQSTAVPQTVNKADQTITFGPLPTRTDTDPDFPITANASSGLSVTFTSQTPAICSVTGAMVDIIATGNNTCTIAANQSGNSNYNAAMPVNQSFSIISTGPALALVSVNSRKTHGALGDFDIPINPATPLTGPIDVESRQIGTGHRIIFTFNKPISSAGTVSVTDKDSLPIGTPTLSYTGNDVTVTVVNIPDIRRVLFTLSNVNGDAGSYSASVGFFVGDVSNNRFVNTTDILLLKGRSGPVTSTTCRFDLNNNGFVNTTDILLAKGRSGPLP